jgi:hypothetical protein
VIRQVYYSVYAWMGGSDPLSPMVRMQDASNLQDTRQNCLRKARLKGPRRAILSEFTAWLAFSTPLASRPWVYDFGDVSLRDLREQCMDGNNCLWRGVFMISKM